MLTFGVVINHFDLMWSILDEKEVGMFIIINLSALIFKVRRTVQLQEMRIELSPTVCCEIPVQK